MGKGIIINNHQNKVQIGSWEENIEAYFGPWKQKVSAKYSQISNIGLTRPHFSDNFCGHFNLTNDYFNQYLESIGI